MSAEKMGTCLENREERRKMPQEKEQRGDVSRNRGEESMLQESREKRGLERKYGCDRKERRDARSRQKIWFK